jgi:predicted O-methyltransferase YrrM
VNRAVPRFDGVLFALATTGSAFALFQVQPLVSKLLLPWFGGVAWVWAVCLVFFQVLLLCGYAYSHLLSRALSFPRQIAVHGVLLALGLVFFGLHELVWPLPLRPDATWHPHVGRPVFDLLGLLVVSVGPPYFLLAATSPLVQSWFNRGYGGIPYRLYAFSNLGSLLGLFSYPVVIEPLFDVWSQSQFWGVDFVLSSAAVLGCGVLAMRHGNRRFLEDSAADPSPTAPLAPRRIGVWFIGSAVPSAMLVATTTLLTEHVAPVPILWVLPLGLYLLTLIAVFYSPRVYRRGIIHPLFALSAFASSVALSSWGTAFDAWHLIAIHVATLFLGAFACHGEVVRAQPDPRDLTLFYLVIAAGGAVGGALVTFGAPAWLPDYWELPILLFVTVLTIVGLVARDGESWLHRHRRWLPVALLAGLLLTEGRLAVAWLLPSAAEVDPLAAAVTGLCVVTAALLFVFDREVPTRALRVSVTSLLVATLVVFLGVDLARGIWAGRREPVARVRSFYGVLSVVDTHADDPVRSLRLLRHGTTIQGLQLRAPAFRRVPTSYYHTGSGVAIAIEGHVRRDSHGLDIGVVGLGAGALAAYVRPEDTMVFYELDPNVVRLANDYFTFLEDAPGTIELVRGDARLSMREELERAGSRNFDLIVLDAFSGDAVPVHLLSAEAFELYEAHLRDDTGLIAINISNRYLDLEPLVTAVADARGVVSAIRHNTENDDVRHPVTWALVAPDAAAFANVSPGMLRASRRDEDLRPWTDDYSNIMSVMRHR